MEQLSQELQQAIARRNEAQAVLVAILNHHPVLPIAQGYAACKPIRDAHQARLQDATTARDEANAAYEDVKQRFLTAYHDR